MKGSVHKIARILHKNAGLVNYLRRPAFPGADLDYWRFAPNVDVPQGCLEHQ
jgi:hypothetical protein